MTDLLRAAVPPHDRYGFVGVPWDAATTLGYPGARYAPPAVRDALRGVFDWRLRDGQLADADDGIVDLSDVEVADFGDIPLAYHNPDRCAEQEYDAVTQVLREGFLPLIVGGDHGVTYPAVRALHDHTPGMVGVIQLDAHNDLMDRSARQGHLSGSSGMRRSLELARVDGANFVAVGLRGYTTIEQYQASRSLGVTRITAKRFAEIGVEQAATEALDAACRGTDAVYLTIDLDVLTNAEAPGTGWPEPGGLTAADVIRFVRRVAPHVHAVDVAELNPLLDRRNAATTLLAARILLDVITTRRRARSA